MLTAVIAPHFGPETLVANGPFTSVMNNATVNMLLWGTSWGIGAGQMDPTPVLSEAVNILTSTYLKGLTEYDSNGLISSINAYVDNATSPPAGFDPGNLVGANLVAAQNELTSVVTAGNLPGPGLPPNLESAPIYVVIVDPADSINNGSFNTSGVVSGKSVNLISVGTNLNGTAVSSVSFGEDFSHEMAERMTDVENPGGVRLILPAAIPTSFLNNPALPVTNPANYVQIADGEPEPAGQPRYFVPLSNAFVQAFWSDAFQAFIVPDGNSEVFNLTPLWNGNTFTGKFDLTINGDQVLDKNDIIAIDVDPAGNIRCNLNGQVTEFTPSELNSVTVNGLTGSDALSIDLTNDSSGQLEALGMTFNGGPGAANSVAVLGDVNMTASNSAISTPAGQLVAFNNVQTVNLTGGPSANHFTVTPSATTTFNIDGMAPGFGDPSGGDRLTVIFTGTTGAKLTYSGPPNGMGQWTFTNRLPINFTHIEKVDYTPIVVVGADSGAPGSKPWVSVYDANTGALLGQFLAYEANYQYGVHVTQADLNGDGIPEIITSPGRLHAPVIKIFNLLTIGGPNVVPEASFTDTAYGTRLDGFSLAAGDVNLDGKNDIVLAPSRGVSDLHVFINNNPANGAPPTGANFALPYRFTPFSTSFIGGATVAIDGTGDILIGSGSGMQATIRDFHFNTLTFLPNLIPFAATFRGGISSIAVSDVDGDGMPDVVVGSGQGGQGQFAYFSSKTATWKYVAAYNDSGFNSHVYIATIMVDSDGVIEVFTGQGQDGRSRKLRRWNLTGATPTSLDFLTPSITVFGGFLLG